jgi:hypothetical protein
VASVGVTRLLSALREDAWMDHRDIRILIFGPDVRGQAATRTSAIYGKLQQLVELGTIEKRSEKRNGFYVSQYRRMKEVR